MFIVFESSRTSHLVLYSRLIVSLISWACQCVVDVLWNPGWISPTRQKSVGNLDLSEYTNNANDFNSMNPTPNGRHYNLKYIVLSNNFLKSKFHWILYTRFKLTKNEPSMVQILTTNQRRAIVWINDDFDELNYFARSTKYFVQN